MTDDDDTRDPLDLATAALDAVTPDPREATLEDLRILAAAQEGLTRHALALRTAMATLIAREADGADLMELLRERGELEALHERYERADRWLTQYTRRALRAHGFDLADLLAGDNTEE